MKHETEPERPARLRDKVAVALRYRRGEDQVPTVAATGRGLVADHILDIARERGIPVREDAELAAALCRIEAGRAIPAELYSAVAEVIAFVYRLGAAGTGRAA